MTMKHKYLLLALLLLPVSGQPPCRSCMFDIEPEREQECTVYGAIRGNDLIPWYRADETCLNEMNVSLAAVDKVNMWEICPFANGTGVNRERLTNLLRNVNSQASNAVKELFPNLFVKNGTSFQIPDTITDRRFQTTNCTGSLNLCWSTIGYILGDDFDKLDKVCEKLHELQVISLLREQGKVRKLLCSDAAPSSCEPLASQVKEIKAQNPGLDCSKFNAGPGDLELPECETSAAPSRMTCLLIGMKAIIALLSAIF